MQGAVLETTLVAVDMDQIDESGVSSVGSVSLNQVDDEDHREAEGIALLRQIFPEESTEELRRLHHDRITRKGPTDAKKETSPPPLMPLGEYSLHSDAPQEDVIPQLEARVVKQCGNNIYSRLIRRDPSIGLGLTLYEHNGSVRVHSITSTDGRQFSHSTSLTIDDEADGPAILAGIRVGDHLMGINGATLKDEASESGQSLLHFAVVLIRESPDPMVLHLRPNTDPKPLVGVHTPPRELHFDSSPALLDSTNLDESSLFLPDCEEDYAQRVYHSTPMTSMNKGGIHAVAAVLAERGILKSTEDQLKTSRLFLQLDDRARQWETSGSFHLPDAFVPLLGIRQSLTVRILNCFLDNNTTAYTIWVYDVESGTEWYAPLRYWEDFVELRTAVTKLEPTMAKWAFPRFSRSLFRNPLKNEKEIDRERKSWLLEGFLRKLCAMIHTEPLHAASAEAAVLVQSFIGCDAVLENPQLQRGQYESAVPYEPPDQRENESGGLSPSSRKRLKRSLQKYTHRLMLLPPMQQMVDQFVETMRSRRPQRDDLESLEAEGQKVLKQKAMEDLRHVQGFLDYMQEMLLCACLSDYRSIAERDEYEIFQEILKTDRDEAIWNHLVREAVREQLEIEVYVPLRSVVSLWLVTGWKHEDMECHFKMKELRKRSQHYFRVEDNVSSSSWESVATILRRGVGESTLPCAKLRATVDAAREIATLFQTGKDEKKGSLLGADDFLPIFIFCVVRADVERPCALCVLLRTLCDSANKIGEVGYYLASFEAAIAHIQELDLSEESEEMLPLLSVPLNDM